MGRRRGKAARRKTSELATVSEVASTAGEETLPENPAATTTAAAAAKPSLDQLPPETKMEILSYLLPSELLKSVMRLNRGWNALASDPSLWHTIFARSPPNRVSRLRRLLARFPQAKRVVVEAYELNMEDIVLQISLTNREHIEELELKGKEAFQNLSVTELLRPLEECSKLRSLTMRFFTFNHFATGTEGVSLNNLTELRLVRVCCSVRLQVFVEFIGEGCPKLELLQLGYDFTLTLGDVVLMADRLECLRALLLDIAVGVDSCQCLAERFPKLEALSVVIRDESAVLPLFAKRTLKFLDVRSRDPMRYRVEDVMPTVRIAECLEASSRFGSLKAVTLKQVVIDDASAENLASSCPNLEWLSTFQCEITDAGVSVLVRACPDLKFMAFHASANITGGTWLPTIGDDLPKLRFLSLCFCTKLDRQLLETAALRYPRIVMCFEWNSALPPNYVHYPHLDRGIGDGWNACPITLAALDGSGIPYAETWHPFLGGEENMVQFKEKS